MLVIGDELLDGRVTDTNSVRFARALAEIGLRLSQRTTVLDDIGAIVREAKAIAARGTSLCVVSGGLGPTNDDRTAEAFAHLVGVGLVRDEEHVRRIEDRLARRGRPLTESHLRQADRPDGSAALENTEGSAPGFSLVHDGCRFFAMPGVPRELEAMLEASVMQELRAEAGAYERRVLRSFGLVEGEVDARLVALHDQPTVRLGFRVKFPEIHVLLSARTKHRRSLDDAVAAAREALGVHVFSDNDATYGEVILDLLRQKQATLALAESCTGGYIGDLLTDVPGSSEVLISGVIAYANEAKERLLGVRAETLAAHGAVSEATVLEMAQGARERAGATYGLAVSGIAGPGGGSEDKPVGTVWIAALGPGAEISRQLSLPFERRGNKVVAAYTALDVLRRHLLGPAA
jgi:nicotinamide-nucleotide amidase